jgi:hypothetical protein
LGWPLASRYHCSKQYSGVFFPAGTTLAGTQGAHQWCVLRDGTKYGPEWFWDKQGGVTTRMSYDNGASSIEMRGPGSD